MNPVSALSGSLPTMYGGPDKVKGGLGQMLPPVFVKPPEEDAFSDRRRRPGGGRWRRNAAGFGGRGGARGGGGPEFGVQPGMAPGGARSGRRRGTPERQAIHAQRQADRRSGLRPRMGRGGRGGGQRFTELNPGTDPFGGKNLDMNTIQQLLGGGGSGGFNQAGGPFAR